MAIQSANTELEPPITLPDRPDLPHGWVGVGVGLVCAAALAFVSTTLLLQFVQNRPVDLRPQTAEVGPTLEKALRYQQIPKTLVTAEPPRLRHESDASYFHTELTARVPDTVNFDGLVNVLETSMMRNGVFAVPEQPDPRTTRLRYFVSDREVATLTLRRAVPDYEIRQETSQIVASSTQRISDSPSPTEGIAPKPSTQSVSPPLQRPRGWKPPRQPTIQQAPGDPENSSAAPPTNIEVAAASPRVAIVIDDGGYGGVETEMILGLDPNLTISILPYTPFGTELSERCHELGFEVMLHMPMSNQSARMQHEGQLNVGMDAAEIVRLTDVALMQVPGAVGVNNHTGSGFTTNHAAMIPFLEYVKTKDLFFLDSRTTPDSIAYETAVELGLDAVERTLFLDHDNAPDAIRARFRQLMAHARESGAAIGICHFRPNTAIILKEMLPELAANGIKLVPLSELVS